MTRSKLTFRTAALAGVGFVGVIAGNPASAQIVLDPAPQGAGGNVVCMNADNLAVSDSTDGCNGAFGEGAVIHTMTFSGGSTLNVNNGAIANFGGSANFDGTATFNSTVSMNGTQTISGNTSISGTTQIGGASLTVNAGSTFNAPVDITAALTTAGITNTGSITTGSLNASSGLTASSGANVNMGGNQVHGIAAGTANTDAVNVGQLNSVTGNVTQLQTTVATHTAQIASLNTSVSSINTDLLGIQSDIGTLFDLRTRDRREARRGAAAAVAMSEAPMPSRDGGISYSLHGSIYRGEYAVGGSFKYRINAAAAVDVGLSYAGHNDTAARVGVSGEF